MSRLMVTFFADLAGHPDAYGWASASLAAQDASEAAKQNALAVLDYAAPEGAREAVAVVPSRQNLARVDLRGQDLTGRDLREADLRGAILRDMRLDDVDLSGADLSGADFSGVVMTGCSPTGKATW
jgi:uncharacterized protein YjbI with pentapeptide repeats